MKRVLLTGAGGFVGHHVLEHLLVETDWHIVCLDSFRHKGKTSRVREVLTGLYPGDEWVPRVTVLRHDLRVPIDPQLNEAIGSIDYVLSVASDSHVDRSIVEPRDFIESNVALVLTLLEWLRERQEGEAPSLIEKFLHISTDEVYGPAPAGHNHAEGEPHRPSNPYSASKACQEDIVYSYWRTYGLPLGISNTMNIIGERQDPEKFVPLVMSKIVAGEPVQIHARQREDGAWIPGSRFYLHARNQADALLFLLRTQPFPRYGDQEFAGQGVIQSSMGRWNVVGEREVDNAEMAQMIAQYAGLNGTLEFVDFHSSRPGHDLRYALDGTKLAELGWTPPMPLAKSLESTVKWTLANRRWLL